MAFKQPWTVYQAASNIEAYRVCELLNEAGIEAMVSEEFASAGNADGTVAHAITPEVWIEKADAERAEPVIAAFEARLAARSDSDGEQILVECDECHARSPFPASMQGSVETCPKCGEYIDLEPVEGEPAPNRPANSGQAAGALATQDNPYGAPQASDEGAREGQASLPAFLFSFQGRVNRRTWCIAHLFFMLPFFVWTRDMTAYVPEWTPLAWFALSAWPSLVLSVKRLHDQDVSGKYLAINLFVGIGWVIFFVIVAFLPGTPGPNRYGPRPGTRGENEPGASIS